MPNGGSDCCGTCWFNRKNRGKAGYEHTDSSEANYCEIRSVEIEDPFWTYCANHPHRSPDRDAIPIGPIMRGDPREMWEPSPDSQEIREHLLALLARIEEQPSQEYPIGVYRDDVVVWQLGDFREPKAIEGLERVSAFDPQATTGEPFLRTGDSLVKAARDALRKIRGREAKNPVLCPRHESPMRRLKILWGFPAEPSETEVIYGGCVISSEGGMPGFGYVCSQCEAESKQDPSEQIPRAYVLKHGRAVPLE